MSKSVEGEIEVLGFERHVAGAKRWSERGYKQGRLSLIFPIPSFLHRYLAVLPRTPSASTMSSRSATPASTPSLVNRRLASLLVVLEAPPTADAALDVVEEWAQDLSPLVLAYRKALGAIRDKETELRVAAAVKQLTERASESWVEWARGDWPELATAIDAEVERRVEEQKRLAEEEARHVEEAAKRAKAAEDRRLEDERCRKDEEDREGLTLGNEMDSPCNERQLESILGRNVGYNHRMDIIVEIKERALELGLFQGPCDGVSGSEISAASFYGNEPQHTHIQTYFWLRLVALLDLQRTVINFNLIVRSGIQLSYTAMDIIWLAQHTI
ncbi:predicted protein [Postia placenta Mad-698-R]|nr:predicted protein [Postia placenta Mad-698-R]